MKYKNTRGSEWRKWDLHIHTPKSIQNNYGGDTEETWEKYITALENLPKEVSVVGITDYYFIDGFEKVFSYKKNGRLKNLAKIFPILEFRIDTFGSGNENKLQKINLHILFDLDEDDIENEIKKVRESFIGLIPITKLDRHKTKMLSRDNFIAEGGSLDNGFSNLIPSTDKVFELINSEEWRNNVFLFLGYKEWSNLDKNQQLKPFKEDLYNKVGAFFSSNYQTFKKNQEWLDEFGDKRLLHSLDIHDFDGLDVTNNKYICNTWIKADPTFEGLKQILFEPKERVRIQENNPELDFEKSPITEIQITGLVKLFEKDEDGNNMMDDDNISFSSTQLPLNNGMVSIIGGRGTGKSRLIDYIAVGLGKNSKISASYTQSPDVIVKHKASLQDTTEQTFSLSSREKQFPFMYISQSEIKEIVENSTEFSKKIRELIGIPKDYTISESITLEAKKLLSEYSQLFDSLYANGTSSKQKKDKLDIEITQNQNFIKNVTSEENKTRLEEYKQTLDTLHRYQQIKSRLEQLKNKINNYQIEINDEIVSLSSEINTVNIQNLPIRQINNQETIDSIGKAIETMTNFISEEQHKIDETKNKFPDYSGNLATLLDNIQSYQNNVVQLQAQKDKITKDESRINEIIGSLLRTLGEKIENDINNYKDNIIGKWNSFVSGNGNFTDEQKKLLANVLGNNGETENISMNVSIIFDKGKLIEIISHEMDKRTRIANGLENILGIDNFDTYLGKIKSTFDIDIFGSDYAHYTKHLLAVLYTKYTEFISHKIDILINNKPLKKLSVGQRGTAYLRLQLAANLLAETIIYDQPEDDLDNDFITNSLVDLFKEIKKYRQVIIVSHNANLVVNADSEQVIVAQNDDGTLSYKSGALESPDINKEICRILEGGRIAFEKREKKYGFTK